jgi:hypothetical protein
VEVHGAPAERRPGEELPKAPAIESAKVPRRKRRRERLASEPVAQLEPSEAAESDDVELN